MHFDLETWLYHQKANKTTFPTISCQYGNIVNFSHTNRINFSANNTSFRPFKWVRTDTHTDTQKWRQYIRQFHSVHLADINIGNPFRRMECGRERYTRKWQPNMCEMKIIRRRMAGMKLRKLNRQEADVCWEQQFVIVNEKEAAGQGRKKSECWEVIKFNYLLVTVLIVRLQRATL